MPRSTERLKIAVFGAGGYIGLELLQRLSIHPDVELVFISSETNAGMHPHLLFPPLRRHDIFKTMTFQKLSEFQYADLVFSALPTGVMPKLIDKIISKTPCTINISGDFRLTDEFNVKRHYPDTAGIVERFSKKYAVPEFETCLDAQVLSTPGCMAAAAIYAIYPLAKAGLLGEEIVVDAKTGSSGGGSKLSDAHAIRSNNAKTHKMIGHRHGAEIEQFIRGVTALATKVHMTTTSLDMPRGVLVHVHGNLVRNVTEQELRCIYTDMYRECKNIRIVAYRTGKERYPSVKSVVGTNDCEVGFAVDESGRHFVATSALDNLVKGGAGNAIQVMNRKYHFEENGGLSSFGVWP